MTHDKYFSVKKRQHTLKSLMIGIPEAKDIVELEIGVPGPTADINLFRKSQEKFDKSQPFAGDKGFQGGENLAGGQNGLECLYCKECGNLW
ncbi:MAG: transposase family protein [Nostoc indistinguendum CM1-VF10]|nr:transposase family protein [Nostoc indistinguendum CM1-VF10]